MLSLLVVAHMLHPTGVLLCACTDAARKQLSKDFSVATDMGASAVTGQQSKAARRRAAKGVEAEQRPLGKHYRALVTGVIEQDEVSQAAADTPAYTTKAWQQYSLALRVTAAVSVPAAVAFNEKLLLVPGTHAHTSESREKAASPPTPVHHVLQGEVRVPIGLVELPGLSSGLFAASATGKPALSQYKVLHRHADSTLVEVSQQLTRLVTATVADISL